MGVGQAYRHDKVTDCNIKLGYYQTGDVELLESDLSTLLHLGLIFAVFRVFKLESCAGSSGLYLEFGAEYPFGRELVVHRDDKTRNGDGGTMPAFVAIGRAAKTVCAIVLERSDDFTIPAYSEATVTIIGDAVSDSFQSRGRQHHDGRCCSDKSLSHLQFLKRFLTMQNYKQAFGAEILEKSKIKTSSAPFLPNFIRKCKKPALNLSHHQQQRNGHNGHSGHYAYYRRMMMTMTLGAGQKFVKRDVDHYAGYSGKTHRIDCR